MKMKAIHIKNILWVVLLWAVAGCGNQFLNRPPEDSIVKDNFYQTSQDLRRATMPLYNVVWFTYNDKDAFCIGDAAAGNMITTDGGYNQFITFTVTTGNDRLNEAWRGLYTVISQSNLIIQNINAQTPASVPEADKNGAIGEAKFMRAMAYFYLVRIWGSVPIITDNISLISDPVIPRNKVEDVYQFIINDLTYAAENLPSTDDPGRVTKWSAEGMLSKVYLFRSGLDHQGSRNADDLAKAKQYAADVINNSGASLMSDYTDLFLRKNNNNKESLFALQWVANQNWGTQNTTQAYLAAEPKLTGVGDGWGGGTSASSYLVNMYSPEDSIRQKATFMFYGDYYPYLLQKDGGYTYTGTRSAIKKYVVGTPSDNDGNVGFMSTDINTYMLRLAEVYLIYSESILGDQASTTDGQALQYYNAVRERAGLSPKSSITFDDIWNTKWRELAYEGQDWFELVRLHYFNPQKAITFINDQKRNTDYSYDPASGDTTYTPPTATVTVPSGFDFTFPYPEQDVLANPKLNEPPVAYDFANQK